MACAIDERKTYGGASMHRTEECKIVIGKDFVRVGHLEMKRLQHIEFVKACLKAGLKPYVYEGRFCYIGPGVTLPSLNDMDLLPGNIPLSWDNLGNAYVVHPSKSTNETNLDRISAMQFLHKIRKELNI
jgi:hypothetical protein